MSTTVRKPRRLGARAIFIVVDPVANWLLARNDRLFVRELPNSLTVSRGLILLAAPLGALEFHWGHLVWATGFYAICVVLRFTDFLDGRIAWRLKVVSTLGMRLDPLFDKIGLLAIACSFTWAIAVSGLALGWLWLTLLIVIPRLSFDLKLFVMTTRGDRRIKRYAPAGTPVASSTKAASASR